ncbi:hypothetical protein BDU57DRAFT_520534 [Ampelomyces quisqualis]|uniref:Uncharacterized protein n=1 Tax=Ampelomyces quisqualis TaxID=50730 RepID=A0A6A5QGG4_AMPQU|nr:hypothetical protein BDU57DRAFT_520534 [Ampelomyces quisqualis]
MKTISVYKVLLSLIGTSPEQQQNALLKLRSRATKHYSYIATVCHGYHIYFLSSSITHVYRSL